MLTTKRTKNKGVKTAGQIVGLTLDRLRPNSEYQQKYWITKAI